MVASRLQGAQVDEWFDQGTERTPAVQRAVEAVESDIAPADDGDDVPALRRGHDNRPFELGGRIFPAIQPGELPVQRELGLLLSTRLQAGVDPQACLGQILLAIVASQHAAHEVEIARIVGADAACQNTQRFPGRGLCRLAAHDSLVRHELEHEVTSRLSTSRMTTGIVIGGSAHDRDHRCDFGQIQLRQRFAEIELARKPEAMHRPVAVLAEEDLVDVGVHEIGLAEMRLEREGHDGLLHLARYRAPRIEEVAPDELLGERAAALLELARPHIDPQRPQERFRIHSVMPVELAVFDRLQRRRQQRRDLVRGDDDPIFTVDREDTADHQGLQAHDRQILPRAVTQAFDRRGPALYRQDERGPRFIRERGRAQRDIDARTLLPVGTGPIQTLDTPILQPFKLVPDVRLG